MLVPLRVHSLNIKSKKIDLGIKTEPEVVIEKLIKDDLDILSKIFSIGDKNGIIFASGNSCFSGGTVHLGIIPDDYPTIRNIPLAVNNILIGKFASSLGVFSHISTDSTACISGHMALKMAKLLMDAGELDRVLIVSADHGTSYDILEFFSTSGACTTVSSEGTSMETFNIGQGANYILLENTKSIEETGNKPVARILSVATSAEYHNNPLGISGSGNGYRNVLSSLNVPNIDFIKLHDTKTPNNEIEKKVVSEFFDSYTPLSYKSRIGHTLGSASNLEMCIALNENKGSIISLSAGMGNVFSGVYLETM